MGRHSSPRRYPAVVSPISPRLSLAVLNSRALTFSNFAIRSSYISSFAMAPQGQYTRSRHCFLALVVAVVAVVLISTAIFREELLSAFQTLKQSPCACPSPPPGTAWPLAHQGLDHHGKSTHDHQKQPLHPTTFADLTILDELAPANVLWVNETSTADAKPEAWGISMFHALHCVKMWKESLNPATMMNSHVHSESEYAEHAGHCINYLIQVRRSG